MADDDKAQKRKRPPRKTTPETPDEPETINAESDVTSTESRALVTTQSSSVAKRDEPDAVDEPQPPMTVAQLNAITLGRLVVHYPDRDVDLFMDGATAERVLAVFSGRAPKSVLQDRLVPGESVMSNMWATFDIERPLAISWIPGLRSESSRRMTVDPPAVEESPA